MGTFCWQDELEPDREWQYCYPKQYKVQYAYNSVLYNNYFNYVLLVVILLFLLLLLLVLNSHTIQGGECVESS